MKRKQLDDQEMKILLGDYRRPALGPEVMESLGAAADALDKKPSRVLRPVFGTRAVRALSLAAGLVLVIGLAGLFLLRGPEADQGLSAVAVDGTRTALPAVARLEASADTQFVEASGQQVALAPGSVLDLDASAPATIKYRLVSGSMGLRHHKKNDGTAGTRPGSADFVLEFPGGQVWPLGTELAIQMLRGETRVWCLEGVLMFRPDSGVDQKILAGQVLTLALEGRTGIQDFGEGKAPPLPPSIPFTPWETAGSARTDAGLATTPAQETPAPGAATSAPQGSMVPAIRSGGTSGTSTIPGTGASDDKAPAAAPASPARLVWTRPAPGGTYALALHQGVVLALSPREITVFSTSDGTQIASLPLPQKPASWGSTDKLVFIYEARKLSAYSLPDLAPAWTASTGNLAFTDFSPGTARLYLPSAEGKLYVHSLEDGSLLVSPDLGAGSYGRVLEGPGRIIVSTLRKELVCLDPVQGSRIWSAALPFRPVDDQPLASGTLVVEAGPEGLILALDAATGAKAWEFRLPGEIKGRLQASQGRIAASTGKEIWLVDSRGKGRVLAESDLDLLGTTSSGGLVLGGTAGLVLLRQDGSTAVLAPQAVLAASAGTDSRAVLGTDGQIRLLEIRP